MKQERSKIKSDILLRVRLLYVLFILAGGIVLLRLVWVQLFSAEVAYNADRLSSRIFTEETIAAQRGSILSRDGEPLATSIFRYQAAFDFVLAGPRFAQDLPRAGRLAREAACRLLQGQARFGLCPQVPRGACPPLPAGEPARHLLSAFRGVAGADARPPAGRGV